VLGVVCKRALQALAGRDGIFAGQLNHGHPVRENAHGKRRQNASHDRQDKPRGEQVGGGGATCGNAPPRLRLRTPCRG
jgi:hypothetical protein